MNGTKEVTDGNVRKDFPGGFPGDEHNAFTKDGRTKAEQSMFQWTSRLLHWRQGNEMITKGSQTQFMPNNGIYVIARQYQGKTALTVLNGTSSPATLDVERYAEVIGTASKVKDILTGRYYDLSKNTTTSPRTSNSSLVRVSSSNTKHSALRLETFSKVYDTSVYIYFRFFIVPLPTNQT